MRPGLLAVRRAAAVVLPIMARCDAAPSPLLFQPESETNRRINSLHLLRSQAGDSRVQTIFGNRDDRVEIHDAVSRQAIFRAQWDFSRNRADASGHGCYGDKSTDGVGVIPRKQHHRSPTGRWWQISPPYLASP